MPGCSIFISFEHLCHAHTETRTLGYSHTNTQHNTAFSLTQTHLKQALTRTHKRAHMNTQEHTHTHTHTHIYYQTHGLEAGFTVIATCITFLFVDVTSTWRRCVVLSSDATHDASLVNCGRTKPQPIVGCLGTCVRACLCGRGPFASPRASSHTAVSDAFVIHHTDTCCRPCALVTREMHRKDTGRFKFLKSFLHSHLIE